MMANLYRRGSLASSFGALRFVGGVALSTLLLSGCGTGVFLESCSTFAVEGKSFQISIEPATLIVHPNASAEVAVSVSLVAEEQEPEVLNCELEWTVSKEGWVTVTQTEDGVTLVMSEDKEGFVKVTASVTARGTTTEDSLWLAVAPENSEQDLLTNDNPLVARRITPSPLDGPIDPKNLVTATLDSADDADWFFMTVPKDNVYQIEISQPLTPPEESGFTSPELNDKEDGDNRSGVWVIKGVFPASNFWPQAVDEDQLEWHGNFNIPLLNSSGSDLTVFIKLKLKAPADALPFQINASAQLDGPVGNIAPFARNDEFNDVIAGEPTLLDVLNNDKDVDNDLLRSSISIIQPPLRGDVVIAGDKIEYTSDAGDVKSDSFTYTVKDVRGAESNPATVSLTISSGATADSPTATDDRGEQATTGLKKTIDVLANDSASEGESLMPETLEITDPAINGNAVVTDGKIDYTSYPAPFVGKDKFRYTVKDSNGLESNEATVEITVEAAE